MKFKAPGDTPIYVALLSGHCAVIGSEWRELPPMLHRKALEEGCITDNMDPATAAMKTEAATPAPGNHEILVGIIKDMMANPKQGEFTAADLPNMKVLVKKAGWNVSKEEMMQAVQAIAGEADEPV